MKVIFFLLFAFQLLVADQRLVVESKICPNNLTYSINMLWNEVNFKDKVGLKKYKVAENSLKKSLKKWLPQFTTEIKYLENRPQRKTQGCSLEHLEVSVLGIDYHFSKQLSDTKGRQEPVEGKTFLRYQYFKDNIPIYTEVIGVKSVLNSWGAVKKSNKIVLPKLFKAVSKNQIIELPIIYISIKNEQHDMEKTSGKKTTRVLGVQGVFLKRLRMYLVNKNVNGVYLSKDNEASIADTNLLIRIHTDLDYVPVYATKQSVQSKN